MTFHYRPTVSLTACDLCDGTSLAEIATRDRYGLPVRTTMCETCGLLQINPRMSAEQYAEFYATGMYRKLVGELYAQHGGGYGDLEGPQREYAKCVGDWLEQFVPRDGTFLDIGGSTGIVADSFAKRFGWNPTVLDPASSELCRAAEMGIPVIHGSAETWEPTEQFDVVGMFQTADHLLSVREALSRIRRALKPGGLFIADICEFRVLWLHAALEKIIKVDHPTMLSGYTFPAYLARAGFKVRQFAGMRDYRKLFYACELAEPVPGYLPDASSVEWMQERLNATAGV